MKIALVLAGGGPRGAYQAGVIKGILRKVDEFICAFGNSTGALISTLVAQQNWNLMTRLYTNVKTGNLIEPIIWGDIPLLPDIVDAPDMSEEALLSAAILSGKPNIYNIDPLMKIVDDNVDFNELKEASCEVGYLCAEFCSSQPLFISSKSRASAKILRSALQASVSMPIYMPSVKIGSRAGRYVDGGLCKHLPGVEVLKAKRFNEADVVMFIATAPVNNIKPKTKNPKMIETIITTLMGLSDSNDANSLEKECLLVKQALKDKKFILVQPDTPLPITSSVKFVPEEMKLAYELGIQKAKEVNQLLK